MVDVFVSYARADELQAKRVADALRHEAYSVWRDDELPAHRIYADVIAERLASASAVVVLWSAESVKSQWVRAEADSARGAGTLVQATLDACIPPLPFNQIQCADLSGWKGDPKSPGWRKLAASVRALAQLPQQKDESAPPQRERGQVSVCVLPFANMSGDAEQEYFSDGISEDITTDLSKVSALAVVARNSAFTFKGQSVKVCDIARKLGVTHVLEGSVRKAGNRVRITAQLIDGTSGDHLWADRYDRDLEDIFAIQDEISKAIVHALKLKLLPEEKKAIAKRSTSNVEAYKLYLLARQYWITGNHGDIRREERVMRICSRAVEIDPYYAQAWALLAIAQSNLRYSFGCEIDDGVAAAHTALASDPSIAEAHLPAIRRLEENQLYADADAKMETALRLDPDSWEVNKEAARVYRRQGNLPATALHLEKAVLLMDSDVHAWAMLVTCHIGLGNEAAAKSAAQMTITNAEQILAQDPGHGAAMSFAALGCAVLGQPDRARDWLERAILIDPDNLNVRYNLACVLSRHLGAREAAIRLLERTLGAVGAFQITIAETDPDLDPVRDDPRLQKALAQAKRRLGMKDEAKSGVSDSCSPSPTSAAS